MYLTTGLNADRHGCRPSTVQSAFTVSGPGLWSLHQTQWDVPPSTRQRDIMEEIRERLRSRGWYS